MAATTFSVAVSEPTTTDWLSVSIDAHTSNVCEPTSCAGASCCAHASPPAGTDTFCDCHSPSSTRNETLTSAGVLSPLRT